MVCVVFLTYIFQDWMELGASSVVYPSVQSLTATRWRLRQL